MLRADMQKGKIGYADRLVDSEIAASMEVSRMPVREALLQLKNEGLLESTQRGFVLRQFTPADIANIFEVRLLLEPVAAAAACNNTSLEGLAQMRMAVSDAEQAHAEGDIVRYMQANWEFRSAWVNMVPNPHLAQTINRLRDHADLARLAALGDKEFRDLSLDRARAILDAFLKGDPVEAKGQIEHNLRVCAMAYYAKQRQLISEVALT